jgi:hypothetical protein
MSQIYGKMIGHNTAINIDFYRDIRYYVPVVFVKRKESKYERNYLSNKQPK